MEGGRKGWPIQVHYKYPHNWHALAYISHNIIHQITIIIKNLLNNNRLSMFVLLFRSILRRGLATQLVRQIPNTAIMMSTYEAVVYILTRHFNSEFYDAT